MQRASSVRQWKRRSVGVPSHDVPSLPVFLPISRQRMSRRHAGLYVKRFSHESAHRQTHTHTQTGPILYPRPLTREGMINWKLLSFHRSSWKNLGWWIAPRMGACNQTWRLHGDGYKRLEWHSIGSSSKTWLISLKPVLNTVVLHSAQLNFATFVIIENVFIKLTFNVHSFSKGHIFLSMFMSLRGHWPWPRVVPILSETLMKKIAFQLKINESAL